MTLEHKKRVYGGIGVLKEGNCMVEEKEVGSRVSRIGGHTCYPTTMASS